MAGAGFDEPLVAHFDTCFPVDPMRDFLETRGFDIAAYVAGVPQAPRRARGRAREFLKARMSGFTGDLYSELLQLTQGWEGQIKWTCSSGTSD